METERFVEATVIRREIIECESAVRALKECPSLEIFSGKEIGQGYSTHLVKGRDKEETIILNMIKGIENHVEMLNKKFEDL
jgi:hypothetical protein